MDVKQLKALVAQYIQEVNEHEDRKMPKAQQERLNDFVLWVEYVSEDLIGGGK